MVRIPSEYQEVEYLESTGTQWIDTGVIFGENNFKISCDFSMPEYSNISGERALFSIWKAAYNYWNCFRSAGGYIDVYTSGHHTVGSLIPYDTLKNITLERNNSTWTMYYDELSKTWEYNPQNVNDTSLKLFVRGDNNTNAYAKIYSFTVFNDNNLALNLIPCYRKSDGEIGMYDTVSKTFFTNQGTGTFLKGNDVTYDTMNLMESRRRILLNTPNLESLTGSTLSFKTDMASKLKECKIHFTPIQAGTGDPSPDNVRPITGWDGVTVTRCGKNLTPDYSNTDFWNKNAYFSVNGNITNNNNYRMCDYKPALPNKTYIFSSSNAAWKGIGFYDAAYNPIAFKEASTNSIQLYAPSNTKFYRVYGYWSLLNKQLEEGSEATDYELYTETQITIPFPQTIYGGYVDLVKGEVVEEYGAFEFTGDENIKYTTSWNAKGNYYVNAYGVVPFCAQSDVNNIYCNILKPRSSSYFGVNEGMVSTRGADTDVERAYRYIIIGKDGFGETINECKAKLKELYDVGTPLTVVSKYAKAFVKTHPLTPQTIKTLRGINNIWSDANGNIKLKFWTH